MSSKPRLTPEERLRRRKARDRRRYLAKREQILAQSKLLYQKKREGILARLKAGEGREQRNEARRRCYWANKEQENERTRLWRAANPGVTSRYATQRRAREMGALIVPFDVTDRKARLYMYGNSCRYCGKATRNDVPPYHPDKATEDHAIPLIRGGPHCLANLVLACRSCNVRKRQMTPAEFLERNKAA